MTTDYRLLNVGERLLPGDEIWLGLSVQWTAPHKATLLEGVVLPTHAPIRRSTTLRDELEALAEEADENYVPTFAQRLRTLIAKHWPTQEPTK